MDSQDRPVFDSDLLLEKEGNFSGNTPEQKALAYRREAQIIRAKKAVEKNSNKATDKYDSTASTYGNAANIQQIQVEKEQKQQNSKPTSNCLDQNSNKIGTDPRGNCEAINWEQFAGYELKQDLVSRKNSLSLPEPNKIVKKKSDEKTYLTDKNQSKCDDTLNPQSRQRLDSAIIEISRPAWKPAQKSGVTDNRTKQREKYIYRTQGIPISEINAQVALNTKKKNKPSISGKRFTISIVCIGIVAALILAFIGYRVLDYKKPKEETLIRQTEIENPFIPLYEIPIDTKELSVANAIQQVAPSVVSLTIYGDNQRAYGFGSGIIASEDGYIITNAHVLEGAGTIQAILDSGEEY
ncbi:MAG: hypothetical protein ACRCWR_09420, partial [Saezia sp.]